MQPASNLTSAAWDYVFVLAYQSTDESAQSGLGDDHGGIDPDMDEDKDVRKKLPARTKAKGKQKALSKEPWVMHRENYQSSLVHIP